MHLVDDMTVFVRVVDRKGMSAAGRELRLTTAVVSSRLARLEQRLGTRLLHRTPRCVSTTEEGRVYYEHCTRMLAEIKLAEQRLVDMRGQPAGVLRLSAPAGFGRRYVVPLIPRFAAAHPEVRVQLQLTDHPADPPDHEVDVALRHGTLASSTSIARRIAADRSIVCASPDYLARRGVPQSPEDLDHHDCLLLRAAGASEPAAWRFGPGASVRPRGTIGSDCSDALIDWAIDGHGIVMDSVWNLRDHLECGRLVAVLGAFRSGNEGLSAVMPPRRPQPAKTRAFIDFLIGHLPDLPAAPSEPLAIISALAFAPELSPIA